MWQVWSFWIPKQKRNNKNKAANSLINNSKNIN